MIITNLKKWFEVQISTFRFQQCFSEPLESDARIEFLYQEGDTLSVNQTKEIVVPVPPLILRANTTSDTVKITGKGAGSVIIVLNSTDQRFAR